MDVARSHVQGKPKQTTFGACPSLGCQPCLEVINYTSILTHPVEVSLLHVCFNPFKGSNGSPWIVPLPFVGISVSQNTNGPSKSGDSHKKERDRQALKPSPNSDSISGALGSRPESVPAKTQKVDSYLEFCRPRYVCVFALALGSSSAARRRRSKVNFSICVFTQVIAEAYLGVWLPSFLVASL